MKNINFEKLLIELGDFLHNSNAPILNRLNPGYSGENVVKTVEPLILPDEAVQLYGLWNGTNIKIKGSMGENWIFKMGALMSLERAIDVYKKNAGKDEYWDTAKFPLFESLGGDYYLIDINTDSDTCGMIFFYSIGAVDFDTIVSKYDSLEALLKTILDNFKSKAYYYNPVSKVLEFDPKLEREINRKNNSKSQYWKII